MAIKPNEIETMRGAIDFVSGQVVTFGLGVGYYAYMVAEISILDRGVDAFSYALAVVSSDEGDYVDCRLGEGCTVCQFNPFLRSLCLSSKQFVFAESGGKNISLDILWECNTAGQFSLNPKSKEMKIAISGATGFIGTHLSGYLSGQGYEVIGLGREWFREEAAGRLCELIGGVDVVINLAGAPINRRWTSTYKQILYNSRIVPTRMLVEAINRTGRVQLFISVSAVGYYSSEGCFDEYNATKGTGFLSDLCESWELEARRVRQSVRLAITRFGVVLSPDGGAFLSLVRPVRLGIGTVISSGNQPFSWIALSDLMNAMLFIVNRPEFEGVFNFVSPEQVTNAGFIHALAAYYHAVANIKIPSVFFRFLYGEGAVFLTRGQCVIPARLQETGFCFGTPTLEEFLKSIDKQS